MDHHNPQSPHPYSSTHKVGIEPTFFGKVMTFFALAIAASAAGTFVGMQYLMDLFITSPFIVYALIGVELVLIFTSRKWSTKTPLNRLLFGLFAFITGLTITPIVGVLAATPGGIPLLTKALVITALMFTGAALFGYTTRIDLSGMRGFLLISLIGLIIVGVAGIFIPWSSTFEMVFSGIGVLVFSGFIIYDFQKIKQYPQDRYVDAALALYLDIFNLFLYVLRLLMVLNRD